MKRMFYFALVLLLALVLCACDGNGTTTAAPDPSGNANQNNTGDHAHDYRETFIDPATCTERGMMFLKCNTCGDFDSREIPATGHTEVIDAAVAPTCTEAGRTEGKHCSVCNEILEKQTYVAKHPNCDEHQICRDCGEHKYLSFSLIDNETSYRVNNCDSNVDVVIIPSIYNDKPVTAIGDSAFHGCSGLTSITIPDSVTGIGNYAFSDCYSLTSITIPNSVTSIGHGAFRGCTGLTNIEIPNSVTSIGDEAFRYCTSLTSITIPDSVTNIGYGAFFNCSGLTSIMIPDSVTSIGKKAFEGTAYYENNANWENDVLYIGNHLIRAKTDISGAYSIKDGTKLIAGSAFAGCTSLTSITIPDSVTGIGSFAFHGCSSLTSITIGNGVTSIGNYAFHGCSGLTSITIGNGVTSIGSSAFSYCTGLTSITFEGTTEQWYVISKGDDWNYNTGSYTIYCTDGEISK